MGCYTVPLLAAIVHYAMRRKSPDWLSDKYHGVLGVLYAGAALFGVIDHVWNGDLLTFSLADVALGTVITASITAIAAVWMVLDKRALKASVPT